MFPVLFIAKGLSPLNSSLTVASPSFGDQIATRVNQSAYAAG